MESQQVSASRNDREQLAHPLHFIDRRLRSDSLAHGHVEKEEVIRLLHQHQWGALRFEASRSSRNFRRAKVGQALKATGVGWSSQPQTGNHQRGRVRAISRT